MRAFLTCLAIALPALAVPSNARAASQSGPYSMELIAEDGRTLPTFWNDGSTYVLGDRGERYSIRIRNQSGSRVEFVTSVDGRDVLDGNPASWVKRGYIVNPWDQVVIDGFRLDENRVAAFRFSAVRDSYAARMGNARDVGVIGVAVFTERQRPPMIDRRMIPNRGLLDLGSGAQPAAAPPSATADARSAEADEKAASRKGRPGLGTEFGESRWSHVNEVDFVRSSAQPAFVLSLRYDDRAGLRAMGVNLHPYVEASDVDLRETAQPFRGNYCRPPAGWNQ
ncbi:MAG: hypothetical protein ACRD4E_17115 [Bryobacteraceae bacterium]